MKAKGAFAGSPSTARCSVLSHPLCMRARGREGGRAPRERMCPSPGSLSRTIPFKTRTRTRPDTTTARGHSWRICRTRRPPPLGPAARPHAPCPPPLPEKSREPLSWGWLSAAIAVLLVIGGIVLWQGLRLANDFALRRFLASSLPPQRREPVAEHTAVACEHIDPPSITADACIPLLSGSRLRLQPTSRLSRPPRIFSKRTILLALLPPMRHCDHFPNEEQPGKHWR